MRKRGFAIEPRITQRGFAATEGVNADHTDGTDIINKRKLRKRRL
jgi:hypothetical protein